MSAGVVVGKVTTAEGQLQIFQSYVDQATRAWSAFPYLLISTLLINSVIRKFRHDGVRQIDPLDARVLGEKLRDISDRIRTINARADISQANRHLPWRLAMPRLCAQGRTLRSISNDVFDYANTWDKTVESAAAQVRETFLRESFTGSLDVDWDEAEALDTPEDELMARHSRSAVSRSSHHP